MNKIPRFKSEKEEAEFWATHDLVDYVDDTQPVEVTFVDANRPNNQYPYVLMPTSLMNSRASQAGRV